jgi:hypothetical protein
MNLTFNYSLELTNTRVKSSYLSLFFIMSKTMLTDNFPSLTSKIAYLFRYDRWDNILFLEIDRLSEIAMFLVCCKCQFLEIDSAIHLDKVRMTSDSETLILDSPLCNFMVRCTSVELWDDAKFQAYNLELDRMMDEKRYGTRKPIFNIEELA